MADGTDALGMDMLQHLLDRPIAYQRAYCRLGCGITGALMLSQAVYWQLRVPNDGDPRHREGWWWHTQAEWHDETGLTRTELTTARTRLVRAGILSYRRMGVPARGFYRVDFDRLLSGLQESSKPLKSGENDAPDTKVAGIRTSGARKSRNQYRQKPANSSADTVAAKHRSPQTPIEQQHAAASDVGSKKRERCHHGVVYWYGDELDHIDELVQVYGVSVVESAAAKVRATGRVPYVSVIREVCAQRQADALREEIGSKWRYEQPQDVVAEARRMVQYVRETGGQPSAELLAQAGARAGRK